MSAHSQTNGAHSLASEALPKKVVVKALLRSRYPDNLGPQSWDLRMEGLDLIETAEGERISLWSDGGQTPPRSGWVLMLTHLRADGAYSWTLYGMPKN